MYEIACELINDCTTNQFSFKAYLSRWMAETTQLAPFTYNTIMPKLRASAQAASSQCIGGSGNTFCGMKWTKGAYDGTTGVGQQMSALEVVQGLLTPNASAPLTNSTGGTSVGNSAAGTTSSSDPLVNLPPITAGDRIAATLMSVGLLGGFGFSLYVMVS
jgi:mannan endo-1,6-alpha-mannosidase